MANQTLSYRYEFNRVGHLKKSVAIELVEDQWHYDPPTLTFPDWTLLDHSKCTNCPLDDQKFCPAAKAIYQAVNPFVDDVSFEPIQLVVESPERQYRMNCTMQAALSSLIGLILPFSGCPQMTFFKPMARMHLPLSTEDETVFRVCSIFFLKNYFNHDNQYDSLEKLNTVYDKVREVNKGLAERVKKAGKGDSVANAVVILDCFSSSVPYFVKRSLANLAPWFDNGL